MNMTGESIFSVGMAIFWGCMFIGGSIGGVIICLGQCLIWMGK